MAQLSIEAKLWQDVYTRIYIVQMSQERGRGLRLGNKKCSLYTAPHFTAVSLLSPRRHYRTYHALLSQLYFQFQEPSKNHRAPEQH